MSYRITGKEAKVETSSNNPTGVVTYRPPLNELVTMGIEPFQETNWFLDDASNTDIVFHHEQKDKIMNDLKTFVAPAGRVFISLIFVMFGMNKITNYTATAGWMEAMGVPGVLLPAVIALEVLGGIAIILGWQTRLVSLAFAGFCIASAVIFHANFADQNEMANFLKNIAISGGFLFLFVHGAGSYSLDARASRND